MINKIVCFYFLLAHFCLFFTERHKKQSENDCKKMKQHSISIEQINNKTKKTVILIIIKTECKPKLVQLPLTQTQLLIPLIQNSPNMILTKVIKN